MTHLLIDISVLIKWFHSDGESEIADRQLVAAGLTETSTVTVARLRLSEH